MKDLDEIYAAALDCDPVVYQVGNAKFERFVQAATPVAVGAMIEEIRSLREQKTLLQAATEKLNCILDTYVIENKQLKDKNEDLIKKLSDFIELSEYQRRIILIKEENMSKAELEIKRLESAWQVSELRRKDDLIASQEAVNDQLRQKLADAQRALDGEIALSEFRRNQLVKSQGNDDSENPQPFKWVLFWVSEFGSPVFNWDVYEEKEHAIECGRHGGGDFVVHPVYLGPKLGEL
jgi:multidrug efflux pump subunit AcrA (membrane-fusion protein)